MITSSSSSIVNAFVGILNRTSFVCRILLSAVLIGFLLSHMSIELYDFASLHVLQILPPNFHFWTLFTYSFAERNLISLALSLSSIYLGTILIEPVWNTNEFIRFLLIVQLISAILLPIICLVVYAIARQFEDFIFSTAYSGFAPINAAIFVAIKQFLPDAILLSTRIGRLKNTHLPLLVTLAALILALTNLMSASIPLMIIIGECIGWIYLRYYQRHSNGSVGDMSDHFSWASFFPLLMQPAASVISNATYSFLLKIKICQPMIRQVDFNQLHSITVLLPNNDSSQDAERRRQKALRDLTDRLHRNRSETAEWPNMIQDDEEQFASTMEQTTAMSHSVHRTAATAPGASSSSSGVTVETVPDTNKKMMTTYDDGDSISN